MKKSFLAILMMFILTSCTNKTLELTKNNNHSVTSPIKSLPAINAVVPMPPKVKSTNWLDVLSPVVQEMLLVNNINNNSLLLVNTLKNSTNGNIQTNKITSILAHLIANNNSKFQVIDTSKVNFARQTLGISADDILESRSKAIGLARYLKAKYVLYGIANGNTKTPIIDLQLILVKSGEIIWSGNVTVKN